MLCFSRFHLATKRVGLAARLYARRPCNGVIHLIHRLPRPCRLPPPQPPEFAIGLAIMACVPSSLSSGVTLVIQGYGNGALGLLFTVAGNVTGIVTSPLMVKAVLGSLINAKIDSVDLLVKLGVSILMPLLVGKAVREAIGPIR